MDNSMLQSTLGKNETGDHGPTITPMPSSLCQWSIHIDSEDFMQRVHTDIDDFTQRLNLKRALPEGVVSHSSKDFTEKLCDNIEPNRFSNIKPQDLPLATDHVARAARHSPRELLKDALGFCIMSRNLSLMEDLLERSLEDLDTTDLYPYHLAASYLDGSNCCSVFNCLLRHEFGRVNVNELGHTILDQLMITILKSHSSCLPGVVDPAFNNKGRFEGEEVDICGRWDADSDCIRKLYANGITGIPFEWKHMFCHTSVQTICHCIGQIFWSCGFDFNMPSGLFTRRCSYCGLKLQLFPLHTLILVGLHLSLSGCENENLFGILACLLRLLSLGADPLLKCDISLQALLGEEDVNACSHEELDPIELTEKVLSSPWSNWPKELNTGWLVIYKVLRESQAEWSRKRPQQRSAFEEQEDVDELDMFINYDDDDRSIDSLASSGIFLPTTCTTSPTHDDNYFGQNKVLATLWAAVQTELLTYRRLQEGEDWISQNFNLHTLYESLISGSQIAIKLVQDDMMNPFCDCGEFRTFPMMIANVEDATAYNFSNLGNLETIENWERRSYVTDEVKGELWVRYNELFNKVSNFV